MMTQIAVIIDFIIQLLKEYFALYIGSRVKSHRNKYSILGLRFHYNGNTVLPCTEFSRAFSEKLTNC